ncbi:Hypothetical protein POVN_LOCUS440 [uncultured virus]|nr:Hypothetical protein POVN_LOCUS440 [uncultured virus]
MLTDIWIIVISVVISVIVTLLIIYAYYTYQVNALKRWAVRKATALASWVRYILLFRLYAGQIGQRANAASETAKEILANIDDIAADFAKTHGKAAAEKFKAQMIETSNTVHDLLVGTRDGVNVDVLTNKVRASSGQISNWLKTQLPKVPPAQVDAFVNEAITWLTAQLQQIVSKGVSAVDTALVGAADQINKIVPHIEAALDALLS